MKTSKAFSLIELSVVILIIGILIATVSQGVDLLADYRLTTAQKLTKTSKVAGTNGLIFWYETSLDESFSSADKVDGAVVSEWKDINPQSSIKLNAKAGQKTDSSLITYNVAPSGTAGNTGGPTYVENGINYLPTLRFVNTDTTAYKYLVVDKQMRNATTDNLTLFAVMRYRTGGGHFIDRVCNAAGVPVTCGSATPFQGLPIFQWRVEADGSLRAYVRSNLGQFPSIADDYWDSGYDLASGVSYVITLQRDYGRNFTIYVNGSSTYAGGTPSKADNGAGLDSDPMKIGRHHEYESELTQTSDYDMSELIFFSGDMKVGARKEIEDYLGKKYNIKITH